MKGFIEITLQKRVRLIAINSIVAITAGPTSCRITLSSSIPDLDRPGHNPNRDGAALANAFTTEDGFLLTDVKKLIEAAL